MTAYSFGVRIIPDSHGKLVGGDALARKSVIAAPGENKGQGPQAQEGSGAMGESWRLFAKDENERTEWINDIQMAIQG